LKNFIILVICIFLGTNSYCQVQFETNNITEYISNRATSTSPVDFDKDGDMDIVAYTSGSGTFVFYENDGKGYFTSKRLLLQNIDLPEFTNDIKVLDFDNDTDYDIVTASNEGIHWLENLGENKFYYHNIYISETFHKRERFMSISVSDIDNDSDNDIIVASMDRDYYALFINKGDQTFDRKIVSDDENYTNGANFVLFNDLDQDGDLDIVAASKNSNLYLWFENKGDLEFVPHNITNTYKYSHYAKWLDVGDADNDGDLDLVATSPEIDRFFWLRNDGNQNFEILDVENDNSYTESSYMVKFFDKDNDGDLDILGVSNHFSSAGYYWFENDSSNSSNPFNNSSGNSTVTTISFGNSSGRFSDGHPVFADLADFNGDGKSDVYGLDSNKLVWFQNDGTAKNYKGNYVSIDVTAYLANSIEAGDIDNDGDIDFVGSSDYGRYSWFENIGSDNYKTHIIDELYTALGSRNIKLVDLDLDGDLDILGSSKDSYNNPNQSFLGAYVWYENVGSGKFQTHIINDKYKFARNADVFVVEDFDNDDDLDIIGTLDSKDNTLVYFQNDGFNNFTPELLFENSEISERIQFISAKDINKDGKMDILVSSTNINQYYYLENQGEGVFSTTTLKNPNVSDFNSAQVSVIKSGDIEGDGDIDIIAFNSKDQNIGFYRNSNSEFGDYEKIIDIPNTARHFDIVDVDQDEDMDILIAYQEGILQLINDGNGNFTLYEPEENVKGKYAVHVSHYMDNGTINIISATNGNFNSSPDYSDNGSSFVHYKYEGNLVVPLGISAIKIMPSDCINRDFFQIKIETEGGENPKSYELLDSDLAILQKSSVNYFEDVSVGEYYVRVSDKDDNTLISDIISVINSSMLELDIKKTDSDCNGKNNGKAEITIKGGVLPYKLKFNGNITDDIVFNDLEPGIHEFVVEDTYGCVLLKSFEIVEPDPISVEVTTTEISCFGKSDGEISITAIGGNPPYKYSLDDQAYTDNNIFPELPSGEYEVWVKDSNACVYSQLITISDPTESDYDGDGIGDSCDDDIDGDGILNGDDECDDTVQGETVNFKGCPIFTLPITNFTVTNKSETCRNSDNGKIEISAVATYDYTVSLVGNETSQTREFANAAMFDGLSAGIYELCITISDYPEFEQCYNMEIVEPDALEVNSIVNMASRTVKLQLKGSDEYTISLNGSIYRTSDNEIELSINSERNTILVSTGTDCQGSYSRQILFGSELVVYPNPVANELVTVKLPNQNLNEKVVLKLFSNSGKQIINKSLTSQDGSFKFNVDGVAPGVYTILVQCEEQSYYSRIIKK